MSILFLLGVLLAIPTYGVSIVIFVVFAVAKGYRAGQAQASELEQKLQAVETRRLSGHLLSQVREKISQEEVIKEERIRAAIGSAIPGIVRGAQPSWGATEKAGDFNEAVFEICDGYSIPGQFVLLCLNDEELGMDAYVALLESAGRTFSEQQLFAADFIKQRWDRVLPEDQDDLIAINIPPPD